MTITLGDRYDHSPTLPPVVGLLLALVVAAASFAAAGAALAFALL